MRIIEITGKERSSRIYIGEKLQNTGAYLRGSRPVILTDPIVAKYYGDRFPEGERITIGIGEPIKTLDTVRGIYARLVDLEADRSRFLIGIGGGIVCDIAGFVASTYMRGLRFGFVATTLLAQVDASVGGKNGVNFNGYKNMVGVFNPPEFVICDPQVLKTLPKKELSCGLAEVVKHAAIADASLIDFIEDHQEQILAMDPEVIEELICASVQIKAAVVGRDERESGERRRLNFGHTFGHALEKTMALPHGDAVSIGMAIAARLSVARGCLKEEDAERLVKLLNRLALPTSADTGWAPLIRALKKDKKREGDTIHFVFLNALGNAVVETIPFEALEKLAGSVNGA